MAEPLTDREWYLVRETYATTLRALISACMTTGYPGRIAAEVLLARHLDSTADLRRATEIMVLQYKPGAKEP